MRAVLFPIAMLATSPVFASDAAPAVGYGKIPEWVVALPEPSTTAAPSGAAIRVDYSDSQIRVVEGGQEQFTAYRLKILKPEALPAGNISANWKAGEGGVTVHYVRVIRDGKTIDVLATTKFRVVERERNLEQSVLDGQLTATLQIPGLQVGDEIAFAATVTSRDPVLGNHAFGLWQMPVAGMPGAFRYRVQWPEGRTINWRQTPDLPARTIQTEGGNKALTFELRDPTGSIATDGAPARYNVRRFIEYSEFADWNDISQRIWPLYEKAATLPATSPIRAEAARIAAASSDPVQRAQAALALVEERIRYVYVGLDGGNYRPATADETWERRFGDCKAKTALLLALLRELGIAGEPALVNIEGDDGLDQRLASPGLFNHVVVKATIGNTVHWLDGTRIGDKRLDLIPPATFRWALPLRTQGAPLEPVAAVAPRFPQSLQVLDIDASAGVDKPAKITARTIMRGDEIQAMRTQLAGMAADDADRAVKGFWRESADWIEPETVSWRFDEERNLLIFAVSGIGHLDWEGDDAEGYRYYLPGAGFTPPGQMRRPREQDTAAPWLVEFPRFRCWATTIRLPRAPSLWGWAYEAEPVNRRLGGVEYWRASQFSTNVVRVVMSRRAYLPEISATQAAEVNRQLPKFNNNMSSVYHYKLADFPDYSPGGATAPFDDATDWTAATTPCNAPPSAR